MARAYRPPVSAVMQQQHDILGGEARIFRTKASGDVWQFRMWISDEQKYFRKTLKTRDFDTAVERAKKLFLETMSDVKTGRKIFGITLGELVDQYLDWRIEDASIGHITKDRVVTMRSQLKHLLSMKDRSLKVAELDRQSLYDYANLRKTAHPSTRDVTIINEQSTINHMMKFGYRKGLFHIDGFEFRKLKRDNDAVVNRDTFSLDEYDDLIKKMRIYVSKGACPDADERHERLLVRDCILIASNTMLRVGELWQLRWGDIQGFEEVTADDGSTRSLVTLWVRAEISKTRRSRKVISMGGEYFQRLKARCEQTGKDDFVFGAISGHNSAANEKRYGHWKTLMAAMGIDYKARNLTWYSLRHFAITCRIRAGVKLSEIAKLAGTSVTYIEKHYGHIDDQLLKTAALQNFKISKDGLILRTGQ